MKIFNIDEALKLPQTFNVLMNAMDELYSKRQEEFQKSNPLKEIYQTVSLNQFQKTFGSSTGFKQAFEQTVDYAAYPGFTSGDGFKATISYKPFNGKVVFTTTHLSTYGVVGYNNVATKNPATNDMNLALILASLGLASAGAVLVSRKKLTKANR